MIPKRIVYTWINEGTPDTDLMTKCIQTWEKRLPGYEIHRITLDNVSRSSKYVKDALEAKCWVNASNYARLEDLYINGGVYFDTDIEALKPLDDLLQNRCFLGVEDDHKANQAVIGCEPGHWFVKECMDRIEAQFRGDAPREFAIQTGPEMVTRVLESHGWQPADANAMAQDVQVYNSHYFYPFHYTSDYTPECIRPETYCIHWWAHGWLPMKKRLELKYLSKGPVGGLRKQVAAMRKRLSPADSPRRTAR